MAVKAGDGCSGRNRIVSGHPNRIGWKTHKEEIVALLGLLGRYGVFTEREVFVMVGALENDDPRTMAEVLRERLEAPT